MLLATASHISCSRRSSLYPHAFYRGVIAPLTTEFEDSRISVKFLSLHQAVTVEAHANLAH